MGARPPQQDESGPDVVEFGIPALAAEIEDPIDLFPASGERLVRDLEDPEIPIDAHGRTVSLSKALEDVDQRAFDSEQDLLNALHPVFETYRERTSTGILTSVKALFPF